MALLGFATITVLVLGAAACSGDDDEPATSPTQAPAASATDTPSSTAPEATPTEAAAAGGLSVGVEEGDLGSYLVGPEGGTLYIFTRDAPDTSNCSGDCLATWPPLLATEGQAVEAEAEAAGAFDTIETDAGLQVTYNGAPLYYFAADTAPGDTTGHLVGGVWFLARPDTASTAVVGVRDASFLIGPTGLTLYLFANDTDGVSNCSGGCLENWPALTVPEGLDPSATADASGTLGVFTRDDGVLQVTYNGLPLYYFAGDGLPGDTNGDGVGGVWSLATP
jgi:predicted lipoprotein with Yx(FWY)xxD motif